MLYGKTCEMEHYAGKLRDANTLLSEVINVAPNGVMLINSKFKIVNVNTVSVRKLKCEQEHLIGAPVTRFLPEFRTEADAVKAGDFMIEHTLAKRADGSDFPVELFGHRGEIAEDVRFVVFFHDITRRIEMDQRRIQIEQQIDEANRLEAIGALSAGIAPEINTPIQFIFGCALFRCCCGNRRR